MIKLENISLIGANTNRTKAYVQVLLKNGFQFSHVYILSLDRAALEAELENYQAENQEAEFFDPKEPLLYTLERAGNSYTFLDTEDINELDCSKIPVDYLVYSGLGGQILKRHLFETGKQFIHVHAGILPQFRGSTTVYYSMLKERTCGATAIFLSPGIDEGNIITMERFPMPKAGISIDYIYEPYTRACVLLKAMKEYMESGLFGNVKQSGANANIYYIIHPVLKHIALKLTEESGTNELWNKS